MSFYSIVYLVIIATGCIIGLTHIRRIDRSIKPIVFYLALVVVCEVINYLLAKIYRNNMPGYHVAAPLYFFCLGIFYYNNIEHLKIKKLVPWIVGAFGLFAIINVIFFQPITSNPDNCTKAAALLNIALGAVLYLQLLESPADKNLFSQPVFIITIAILWFNIISFSNFLLYDFFVSYKIPLGTLSIVHIFSNFIYYILLLTAMIMSKIQLANARKILHRPN
jgi:hypothetical protein